jgi:hypothetical protein
VGGCMGPSVSGGKRSNEPGHVLFRVEPRHLHVLRQNQKWISSKP